MVDQSYVDSQLRKIKFGTSRVNKAEVKELPHILLDDEKIYECVNGFYEGGVALLVATDIRVLLIDKKPMGFLNVDDLRFDMISDIDYSHRAFGAQISINCGMKSLIFRSYNQPRLRKLIGHVQHRMSEIKREQSLHAQSQKQHLEDINKQLQMYLLAQQQQLERQLVMSQNQTAPIKPSPQLADYLFAQRLMEDFNKQNGPVEGKSAAAHPANEPDKSFEPYPEPKDQQSLLEEMAAAGRMEVYGGGDKIDHARKVTQSNPSLASYQGVDLTPFRIAYAKLPYLLRNRRRQPSSL